MCHPLKNHNKYYGTYGLGMIMISQFIKNISKVFRYTFQTPFIMSSLRRNYIITEVRRFYTYYFTRYVIEMILNVLILVLQKPKFV